MARRLLNHWDNLDGTSSAATPAIAVEVGRAAGQARPALRRLRARQRVDRHQRRGPQQRQRQPADRSPRRYLEKVAARRGRLPPVRDSRLSLRQLRRARHARQAAHRRPARPRGQRNGGRRRPTRSTSSIPDFGGFLVKANSEGQPGPQDYGRTHADGANVLADALAPHGGIVMWRAFVYDANGRPRSRQARLHRVRRRSTASSAPTSSCR